MTRRCALVLAFALAAALGGCGGGGEPQTSPLEKGGIDALDLLQTLNARTTRVLGTITGAASAETALPDLEAISMSYDDLLDAAKGLSPTARAQVAEEATRMLPGLKDNTLRLASMRGGEVLAPVLRQIVDKVAMLQ